MLPAPEGDRLPSLSGRLPGGASPRPREAGDSGASCGQTWLPTRTWGAGTRGHALDGRVEATRFPQAPGQALPY